MQSVATDKKPFLKAYLLLGLVNVYNYRETDAFRIPVDNNNHFCHYQQHKSFSRFSSTASSLRWNQIASSNVKSWPLHSQPPKSQQPQPNQRQGGFPDPNSNKSTFMLYSTETDKTYYSSTTDQQQNVETRGIQADDDGILEEYRTIKQQRTDLSRNDSVTFNNNNGMPELINFDVNSEDNASIAQPSTNAGDGIAKVIYSTCLIVANSVGASILVVPNTVEASGILIPAIAILAVYALNIVTSFYLSDISIEQYEAGREVPVAFKDIATEAFGKEAGYLLASLSILFNYCILIFGLITFGSYAEEFISGIDMIANIDSNVLTLGYAAVLTGTVGSFSNLSLSKICSFFVALLGISFMGVVIPGLMNADWATFVTNSGGYIHGNTPQEFVYAFMISLPIMVYIMEIQKIVPSVTKLCNFDRNLSRIAMVVGNFVTMAIYCLYVYVSLGINGELDANTAIITTFTFAPIMGSAITSCMSISEEFESLLAIFFPKDTNPSCMSTATSQGNENPNSIEMTTSLLMDGENHSDLNGDKDWNEMIESGEGRFSLPAVVTAIVPPLLIGLKLSTGGEEEVIGALDFAGAYLTPLFIWIFPVSLAWKKLNERLEDTNNNEENKMMSFLKEKLTIATVVLSSFIVIGLEVIKDFGDLEYFS